MYSFGLYCAALLSVSSHQFSLFTVLHCIILSFIVSYRVASYFLFCSHFQCNTMHRTKLYQIVFSSSIVHSMTLYYIAIYCFVFQSMKSQYIVLDYMLLSGIALYCISSYHIALYHVFIYWIVLHWLLCYPTVQYTWELAFHIFLTSICIYFSIIYNFLSSKWFVKLFDECAPLAFSAPTTLSPLTLKKIWCRNYFSSWSAPIVAGCKDPFHSTCSAVNF